MDTEEILKSLVLKEFDVGRVFSGAPTGTKVMGYERPSPFTPKINADYIFHETSRDVIVWLISPPSPLYVCGVSGAGKSSLITQLAARLNYPVFEVTGHNRLELQDLAGHHSVKNGSMSFEYGPLALAMKYGGLFLLNELDLLEPSTATGLNGVLDGRPLCIPENGGELIEPHPMFRFAATANTNGGSDETGLYQGTLKMNMALMDRFTVIEVSYPKPEAELQLLEKVAHQLPAVIRKKMVEYANEVRRLFMGENGYGDNSIEITFSTRTLLRWADLTLRYQPLARHGIQPITYALDRALAFRACRESRAMLHELARRVFPQATMPDSPVSNEESLSGQEAIDFLHQHLASDTTGTTAVHLSMTHTLANNSVSTKIWMAQCLDSGLRIQWGREGTCLQEKCFSKEKCTNHNPFLELEIRATQKLREGYKLNLN